MIRTLSPGEELTAERLLDVELGGRLQARLGEVHDVLALVGYGAWDDDRLVGVATYASPTTGRSWPPLRWPRTGSAAVSVVAW